MGTFRFVTLWILVAGTAFGGEWHWDPSQAVPELSLVLGDGTIDEKFPVSAACDKITLRLRGDGLEQDRVELAWTTEGKAWMSQVRRLPDKPAVWTVTLPPGKTVQLRISPPGRDPVAIVRLLRK